MTVIIYVLSKGCIPRTVCHVSHLILIWLAGYFGFNGPLRQNFSLYWAVSQRGRKKREKDRQ